MPLSDKKVAEVSGERGSENSPVATKPSASAPSGASLAAAASEMYAALKKATAELNAIRARDGAPQHIDWDRGRPLQTSSCTDEYWDALTEECFAALRKAEG